MALNRSRMKDKSLFGHLMIIWVLFEYEWQIGKMKTDVY